MAENTHNYNDNSELAKSWRGLRLSSSLDIIIAAAVLLLATTGVMYFSAQRMTQKTMEQLEQSELNSVAMSIRKQLAKVEVAVNNMDWLLQRSLNEPDVLNGLCSLLVQNNPSVKGCGIGFKPYYYPQKGRWFEPYAVRRADGSIETMQLGSESHDYTQYEFFTFTMEHDSDYWSEPYMDSDGAKTRVTTYSRAVHDNNGEVVAVVVADLSTTWLEELMEHPKRYKSTYRFLLSKNDSLLAGKGGAVFNQVLEQLDGDCDTAGYVTMTDSAGEKQHVFYYPVGGTTGWTLICVSSDREIFAPVRQTRLLLILLQVVGILLISFIVWRTSRNVRRLRLVNAEKDRIGGELKVAGEIQQNMLPRREWTEESGTWRVEIIGSLVPAREVGGDLFDYFIRDEKLFFCIGDVSGKGAASAMVMGVAHALFRSASAHESNPSRIMHVINETGCSGNDSNMFVTMFIGVLDLPTGLLRYCNAGHNCPFIINAKGEVRGETCEAQLPLGVFKDVRYTMQERQLEGASTIFLYTDGLTEARSNERKLFGLERVEKVLATCSDRQPRAILETVTQKVHEFVGDAEQSDDLTMMAIHYTPKKFESTFEETLTLKNNLHEVEHLSNFMKEVAEKLGIAQPLAGKLRLAVEEAVVNVMEYAYPAGKEGVVEIKVMSDGDTMRMTIADSGIPFDPTAREKADTTLTAEDRQIGGLGILLVRDLMDTINYEREKGRNILTLVKRIK